MNESFKRKKGKKYVTAIRDGKGQDGKQRQRKFEENERSCGN